MRPQQVARRLERSHHIRADGGSERLAGYGLMGLAFESGDVIAFHRFTASSIGPPYAAVWHRDAAGRWIFHTSIEPARSCPRYFGPALHDARVDDIEVAWRSAWEVTVSARRARLNLALRLGQTPLVRLLGAASRSLPESLWHRERRSSLMGRIAGRALRSGVLKLAGVTPSGHEVLIRPARLWQVRGAACVLNGREPGGAAVLHEPPRLEGLELPTRPLFAAGIVEFR